MTEITQLTQTFEAHAQQTDNGIEYWLARDLQHLLGYSKWDNFLNVISKAKTACELSGHAIEDHFADVGKMAHYIQPSFPRIFPSFPRVFSSFSHVFPSSPRIFLSFPRVFPSFPRMRESTRHMDSGSPLRFGRNDGVG